MQTESDLIQRTIAATQRAAVDDVGTQLRARVDELVFTVAGGQFDGRSVVEHEALSMAMADAFRAELPPTNVRAAEVTTPATVFVDVICPNCRKVGRVTVAVGAELRVSSSGGELHIKAKASKAAHVCGQTGMLDADEDEGPEDPTVEAIVAEAEAIANEPTEEVEVEEGDAEGKPTGTCTACGKVITLRADGMVRAHTGNESGEKCTGSGWPPLADEKPELPPDEEPA